jgi:hypothetical protein
MSKNMNRRKENIRHHMEQCHEQKSALHQHEEQIQSIKSKSQSDLKKKITNKNSK